MFFLFFTQLFFTIVTAIQNDIYGCKSEYLKTILRFMTKTNIYVYMRVDDRQKISRDSYRRYMIVTKKTECLINCRKREKNYSVTAGILVKNCELIGVSSLCANTKK